jgi:alpha 1,3-glucosidase
MKNDPFTLRVALDSRGSARGEIYLDDGESYSFRDGKVLWREFLADKPQKKVLRISSRDLAAQHPVQAIDGVARLGYDTRNDFVKSVEEVRVERVFVVGLKVKPKSVKVEGANELEWQFVAGLSAKEKKEGGASVLTIKDPGVSIAKDWSIIIQM